MMDARMVADQLGAAGLDEADLSRKAALFGTVFDTCRSAAGTPPAAAWWVPGRLELFGTHTDYAGGHALVGALPRGFAFAMAPRRDGLLRAIDAAGGEHAVIDPGRGLGRFRGWRNYLEVVAGRLARNFPGAAIGADVIFASDLPRAAGMSSSSALVVGVATALIQAGGLRDTPAWQLNIRSAVDEAGFLACIENGRTFGTLVGDNGVGTHGGSEDHVAMLTAVSRACSAYAFLPMRHVETVAVPASWTIVVASSGVRADKTGSARAAYNRLADGTAVLLQLWNEYAGTARSLADALASSDDALATLQDLVMRSHIPGWTPITLRGRLDHFANEDARVTRGLLAIREGDAETLGALADASQLDAELRLKNQVPETALLVRSALGAGAVAARSFGAGFGGSVWAVLEGGDSAEDRDGQAAGFIEQWLTAYRGSCEAGARSSAFTARLGPPLTPVLG